MSDSNQNTRTPAVSPLAGEEGFTLIEMLTALAIFSIVGLAALSLTQRMVSARGKVARTTEQLRRLRQAARTLKSDLARLERFALAPLTGNDHSLTFPIIERAASGNKQIVEVSYFEQAVPGESSRNLLRRRRDFYGNEEVFVLLPKLDRFEIRYRVAASNGEEWKQTWLRGDELPTAVLVRWQAAGSKDLVEILCPIRNYAKNERRQNGT